MKKNLSALLIVTGLFLAGASFSAYAGDDNNCTKTEKKCCSKNDHSACNKSTDMNKDKTSEKNTENTSNSDKK